ncbi:uncharacterized protein LAESUDRAFT_757637 [Laetiporus sulphureus 93-53]|uniref:U3 small nucleolar RNA-associated protein 6 N-terminal domain-containing protein n=1 Tax=Laetiporus sulphureus 93-53 TaxID=1314785 RepID=A0A165F4Z5_9APHY|nr:uncharacterized protein LAESUDRAFT_757637 [Laetiporus sulphureus 93-53]KZT08401.1 hypothetical protein LAESUDRAFT_757637 [Laetiporus sulphureus 93-53]
MERVQFEQEQMLAELKDLVQKGIFTQREVKQIMQKRTAFETALVRRIPQKNDYLRYATYEMGLEALRRKRVKRLTQGDARPPPSVSDYALVRRQFHIFERALKKFKGDVALWIQYIRVAKKEGARTLVGRISARALQLHPNVPALYILAASHELEHLSPSAARALLQRGIRLNTESVELWREYVKMEMGFLENMRRRWSVLGIEVGEGKGQEKGKGKEKEIDADADEQGKGGEDVEKMEVDAEEVGNDGDAAKKAILEGAIVKSVMSSAAKAIPKIHLFTSLHELISAYPCLPSLRNSLLDYLFSLLHSVLPSDPTAIKLYASRYLTPDLEGEDLVDALRKANEELAIAVKEANQGENTEKLGEIYAQFVQEWCEKDIDNSLKGYLVTSLQLLAQRKTTAPPPALVSANIRLLTSYHELLQEYLPQSSNTPEKILRLARKCTTKNTGRAQVWLARLDAERAFGASGEELDRAWDDARGAVQGKGIESVWLWGLDHGHVRASGEGAVSSDLAPLPSEPDPEQVQLLERLLKDSRRIQDAEAWGRVHEMLLARYTAVTHAELSRRLKSAVAAEPESEEAAMVTDTQEPGAGIRKRKRTLEDVGNADSGNGLSEAYSTARSHGPLKKGQAKIAFTGQVEAVAAARAERVWQLGTAQMTTARVWEEVFAQEEDAAEELVKYGCESVQRVLESVYEYWRRKDGVTATVQWGRWLLAHGRAKEGMEVVVRVRSWLGAEDVREVERRWKRAVEGRETPEDDRGIDVDA